MSTRDSLIAYLEPLLAATPGLEDIKLVKSIRSVDRLSQPTLIVKTVRLQKLPAAPIGNMLGEFLLVLVSNHVDVDRAEDQLDDLLEVLLPKLFNSNVVWTAADQTSFEEHVSYDISVSNILK
jgi:hypothetical protein